VLTWPIVLAVLGGALLHALWNVLIKSSRDKALDTALVTLGGALAALPLLALSGLPPLAAWPYVAASLCIHIGYYSALAGAYRHGELGLTYPIMRGFAPLLVALASGVLIGESPRPWAWAGIGAITFGVALVGLAHPGQALHHGKALGYAFANALIIAIYTVVDGIGVRLATQHGGSAWQYVLLLFVVDALPFPALLYWSRSAQERREMLAIARRRAPLALAGGIASLASYAIALWAMTHAPVASVAALRETSVLFGALIGVWWLRERFGVQRAIGTLVIVGGVMALRAG
jgi:phosphonate utilization associated putative membrane protein